MVTGDHRRTESVHGFMILIGVVKLPSIADYWKRDDIFYYAPISGRITRDRFFELQKYLNFSNNSTLVAPGTDGYDRLGKIRPIINMVNERLLTLYHPHKQALMRHSKGAPQ